MEPTINEYVKSVHIIQPTDEQGQPIPIYFVMTDGGFLLHVQKVGDVDSQTIYDYLEKLLLGVAHERGRYNDYVKNPDSYITVQTLNPPITVNDAYRMDSFYRMKPEERRKAMEEDPDGWFQGSFAL